MVRAQRAVRQPKLKKATHLDGDDPAAYEDMPVPDKRSSKYVEDEIAEFHSKKIAKLLADGVQAGSDQEDIADEDEVMALEVSDSDEEDDDDEEDEEEEAEQDEMDMDSDLEGKKGDDLPNEMAWGHRKKMFYDSDYVAAKGKSQEEVEAEDEEEEEEAKNIQRRLVGNLSEEDYDLHLLQAFAEVPEEAGKPSQKEEKIVKDLEKMSHKEKLKLLKKESPELLELIQDFKAKLAELRDEVQPLLEMVSDGRIPEGKGADYLRTKQQLYLNYCTNISFYLVLKAKRVAAQSHPVIERLVSYRNLINDLGEVDARLAPQMRQLLSEAQRQEAARKPAGSKHGSATGRSTKVTEESGSKAEGESESDFDEEAALRFYREQEARLKQKSRKHQPEEEPEQDEDELDPEAKRGITYQMAKNKGLTPKRKKIDRNPRVKHREKFRRAKIRRKGQVREVRKEEQRYSGEWSGIRAGVIKSTKFK
ncbi:something about silencing protein 10 [Anguilla rostrata]|uniref:something about silencing protein 10 n=1 Tax=Anguilla rostrata TaxID=7938 RepID=UPI0030D5837A